MPRVGAIVLVVALAACTPSTGAASPAPTPSSAPGPSDACIDTAQFADAGESVTVGLQGVVSALKLSNTDTARAAAGTTASGLRKLADLVVPVQPEAATDFRTAASELDTAATQFPGGVSLVNQAQTDVTKGLLLASAARCSA
jgi:hypothetical protein